MINNILIAKRLCDLYSYSKQPGVDFNFYEPGIGDSGICWATDRVDNIDIIYLRGSVTFKDWIKDLLALASPFSHSILGPVHPGFTLGMDRCWAEIRAKTTGPWIITGHSLGAGRACILSGLMLENGVTPLARVCFGEPKPGFKKLGDYIKGIKTFTYRNGNSSHHDLVTDVPLTFPPEEYIHPIPLTQVTAEPDENTRKNLGVFSYHHMPLYLEGVSSIPTQVI